MSEAGYACSECGFKLWTPIAQLSVSSLGLYDDARYPGRCILVLNAHETSLEQLEAASAAFLMQDMQTAGRAIRQATGAERINYAVLGNVEPHVHVHLIPRGLPGDPAPGRSPWSDTGRSEPLSGEAAGVLVQAMRSVFQSDSSAQ